MQNFYRIYMQILYKISRLYVYICVRNMFVKYNIKGLMRILFEINNTYDYTIDHVTCHNSGRFAL